jgi:hypothetical protein
MKHIIVAAALTLAAVAAHAAVPLFEWDGKWFHFDHGLESDSHISAPTQNADGTESFWVRADYQNRKVTGSTRIA